jgi:hypothetical protein
MKRRMKRKAKGQSLMEFGPGLLLLFAFIVVPLLFLMRFGVSAAAIYFIVDRAADRAGKSYSYEGALYRANQVVYGLMNTPMARFSGLKPDGVEDVCLLVDEHITRTDSSRALGRDELGRTPVYPSVSTYAYEVQGSYSLEPLLPSSLPFLGKIPFLCAPATLTVRAIRPVEYPDGLTSPAIKYGTNTISDDSFRSALFNDHD